MTQTTADTTAVRFLDDVRVVEVASLAPSQLAMHLGDLGADVVMIEAPKTGDTTRLIGKMPGFADSNLHRRWNRGKRSLALDLATPEGKDVFRQLVSSADILIEGLRPGTLEKLGFDWETLKSLKSTLVFVSLTGYGQSGPYRRLASHGVGFDAIAGLAPAAEDDRGRVRIPTRQGNLGTVIAPMLAATAALAALSWSRRNGQPVFLDVAQADAALFANMHLEDLASKRRRITAGMEEPRPPAPTDSDLPWREAATMQYYRTRDDKVLLLMALERKFFVRLTEVVGRPDLLEHFPEDRYADSLVGNDAVRAALSEVFATRDLEEWIKALAEADVPVLPVNEGADILDDPQVRERVIWLDSTDGTVTMKSPVRATPGVASPAAAPAIGQHSSEVLAELGLDDDRIKALAQAGVVRVATATDGG